MLRQTDSRLPEAVQKWGCYFMSVMYHAETKRMKPFWADEIIAVYKSAMATGIIGKEVYMDGKLTDGCFVNDPVALFRLLGVRVSTVVKTGPEYKAKEGENELLCYHRPAGPNNAEHTHFVPGENGEPCWDPIEDSNTVKYGYLKSKRIIK